MSETNNFKDITVTIIFDGAALNRDEKLGGNIQSVKKLTIDNKIVSFISRPAIRHYLFNSLVKAFLDNWKPAKITGQGEVAQFDITQDDIVTSAELDAFGYMYTISGQNSLTRKAPVGITKAISLFNYNQDMAFYANHDMVQRGNQDGLDLTPNPFQREEHSSFYKLSFTIDSKVFGEDTITVEKEPNFDNDNKKLTVELQTPQRIILKNVEKKEEDDDWYYEIKGKKIYVNGKEITIDESLIKKQNDKKTKKEFLEIKGETDEPVSESQNSNAGNKNNEKQKKKAGLKIKEFTFNEEDKTYTFSVTRTPIYNESDKTLTIETGLVKIFENVNGGKNEYEIKSNDKTISKIKVEEQNKIYKVTVTVDDSIKKERIKNILEAIKSGLVAHSSGEDNTIVPLFMIASAVKVPCPVFHPYIDLAKDDNGYRVIGINDCLNNSWIDDGKIYIQDSDRIPIPNDIKSNDKFTTNWNDFLSKLGLTKNKDDNSNSSQNTPPEQ